MPHHALELELAAADAARMEAGAEAEAETKAVVAAAAAAKRLQLLGTTILAELSRRQTAASKLCAQQLGAPCAAGH